MSAGLTTHEVAMQTGLSPAAVRWWFRERGVIRPCGKRTGPAGGRPVYVWPPETPGILISLKRGGEAYPAGVSSHQVHGSAAPHGHITTAPPFARPAITALVQVDDEPMPRQLDGRALGWTSDAVLVDVGIDDQRYQVWVTADHVTRRA